MAKFIVTDSTSDLPDSYKQKSNIRIVPLNVHIHNEEYKDGVDLTNQIYYQRLRSEPISPLTSQPSSGDFLAVFNSFDPGDEILVILLSSFLSGTTQSALLASEIIGQQNQDLKIEMIDSQSAAIGLGFQVMRAYEMIETGKSLTEVKAELLRIQDKNKIFFVVDNLEYLFRGGRISSLSKQIGNILQLKPILTLNEGKIEVLDKVRTKPKAISRILAEVKQDLAHIENLAVIHIDNVKEAEQLAEEVCSFYRGPIQITESGPVIGTHTGPDTLGLAYY